MKNILIMDRLPSDVFIYMLSFTKPMYLFLVSNLSKKCNTEVLNYFKLIKKIYIKNKIKKTIYNSVIIIKDKYQFPYIIKVITKAIYIDGMSSNVYWCKIIHLYSLGDLPFTYSYNKFNLNDESKYRLIPFKYL